MRAKRVAGAFVGIICASVLSGGMACAAVPSDVPPDDLRVLHIRQLKLGADDAVILESRSDGVQLGEYWLGYSGDRKMEAAPSQELPAQRLSVGQEVALAKDNTIGLNMCSVVLATTLKMALANEDGHIALWHKNDSGFTKVDEVSWMKPDKKNPFAADIDTSGQKTEAAAWYKLAPGDEQPVPEDGSSLAPGWYRAHTIECDTRVVTVTPTDAANETDPTPGNEAIPSKNASLQPMQITELLPNPDGESEVTDEFVELYNPNDAVFDLSGYMLTSGLADTYRYTVPDGTVVNPHEFVYFTKEDTGLVLSNTAGRVQLRAPSGAVVASSQPYGAAKSGQAWAFDNQTGKWHWTTTVTPGGKNEIAAPLLPLMRPAITSAKSNPSIGAAGAAGKKKVTAAAPAKAKTAGAKKTASKKAAASGKTTKPKAKPAQKTSNIQLAAANGAAGKLAVHPGVLAVVALIALGYGLYEYRKDIANRYCQFRANRTARRAHRR